MSNRPEAQDAKQFLHDMLRDQVAPGLRRMGFVGSGSKFSLRNVDGDHALLGFQRWLSTTAGLARFTANVAYYGRAEWQEARGAQEWLPSVPAHNVSYACGWSERIGFLTSQPHDHWWTVRPDEEETGLVARDVLAVVEADVLPQLLARLRQEEPPPSADIVDDETFECLWPFCDATLVPHDLL
jgi:hypothetical protein